MTFVAGLRINGMEAPWCLDAAMNGSAFLAYVETQLCPVLKPGDIVIADNLGSLKVDGVRELIEARGAAILYLPPYSPDLNPIEQAFAKIKALLRKAAARSLDALWQAIGRIIDTISQDQCKNFFGNSGYVFN